MAIFLFLQVNQYVSLALSVFSVIFLVLSTQSRKYKMIILLGCLLAVVLYIMLPAEARQSWANFMAIWTELFHMPARLMMVVFLVILFLSYRLSFKGGVSYLSHQVFLWLLFIMTAAFLILDVFLNANNGEFRRSVVPFFTHQEYRYATVLDVLRIKDAPYINPNEFTWSKFRDKTERDLFIQAAQFLSDRRAIPYSLWLAEPSASGRLSPQLLAGLPLYVDESDRALSELSFSYADDYNRRLKNVFGLSHGMAWLYQDGNFRTRMQKAFNQLTVKKLKQLGQNNGIGYILTRQRYPELQRIYKNKIFNIYKIPVSTVWEKRFRAVQLK